MGYTDIAEAKDGDEAWEQLQEGGVDLLITDWNMPNMSGLELVEKVRANPATAELPIMMSTSRNVKDDIIAAMRAGANNYVSKSYTPPNSRPRSNRSSKSSGPRPKRNSWPRPPSLTLVP